MGLFDSIGNAFSNGFNEIGNILGLGNGRKGAENFHENSSIANIWKGATGQLSNEMINRENMDFSKAMTQAQWERDDSSYQRAVADAEAAGLSPLSISGGAPNSPAVTSGPMQPTASGSVNPFQFVEGIMNAFNNRDRLSFDREEAEKTHSETSRKLDQTAREIEALEESNKIKETEVQNNLKIAQDTLQFNKDNLDYLKAKHLDEYSWKQTIEAAKQFKEGIEERYKGWLGTFKPCYTPEELKKATLEYEKVCKKLAAELGRTVSDFNLSVGSNLFGSVSAGGSSEIDERAKVIINKYLPKLKIPLAVSESERKFIDENGNFRVPDFNSSLDK